MIPVILKPEIYHINKIKFSIVIYAMSLNLYVIEI
jgi:hypothetical protein